MSWYGFSEFSGTEEQKDGDADDASSDEFTDSIEEDDCKVTAHSFTCIQVIIRLFLYYQSFYFSSFDPLDLKYLFFFF